MNKVHTLNKRICQEKKRVGTSGRPKLGSEGECYVNDVSFHRSDIGRVDQQSSAKAVGQTAENPLASPWGTSYNDPVKKKNE